MRQFGILLHISSLPSAWGIGDLGPAAHTFAATLAEAGAGVWQFLPLNPTSTFIGNSPYSSPSAFAGNPIFISPELLVQDGYISHADLDASFACLPNRSLGTSIAHVDHAAVTEHRSHILNAAFERGCPRLAGDEAFQSFCREHQHWLHDYARFVSIKEEHNGVSWVDWPDGLRGRESQALAEWDIKASKAIMREKFTQYLFFSQWLRLRKTCNSLGVSLLADVPIYVTHDSADVWANPQLFKLDKSMQPITVSGVPPDYFSETGQLWGNPVYKWDVMAQDGFQWWKQRLGHTLYVADMARLDHFRGFCGYWEIPSDELTAINGSWTLAPAKAFFTSLREHFNGLPFVAEDLGIITEDVVDTMRQCSLPGMHVLQFAFGGSDFAHNSAIPHAHTPLSLVYTGTHDNPPTRAWFHDAGRDELENFTAYAGYGVRTETASLALTRMAFASVSNCAVIPMQDVLNLGHEARMNTPGTAQGNWTWRMTAEQADPCVLAWVTNLAGVYGRLRRQTGPTEESSPVGISATTE